MKNNSTTAFTLVELIVVITILAILWTIGFLSFNGYTRDARNSTRISDLKIIEKWLDLNIVSFWFVPLPDSATAITYSGGIAWTQWVFWTNARAEIKRISDIPVDPLFSTPYAYSVVENRRYYQLAGITEWGALFWKTHGVSESYALSNSNFSSYNLWNYLDNDIVVENGWNCYVITTPSIMLSDIPTWWILENNTPYNYSYTKSPHITSTYSWSIENSNTAPWFQNIEIFSWCEMNTISELELYNAKISTAYQQFANESKYQELIFNSKSNNSMLKSARSLDERWIKISKSILDQLIYPTPDQTFTDTFTEANPVNLVGWHTADSLWDWLNLPGWDSSAYVISWNVLLKTDASQSKIYPRPNPNIASPNYSITLTVIDFAGGNISLYLRYLNNENYYRVELNSNGYTLYQNLDGTELDAWQIVETIADGSEVIFSVDGDNVGLSIAWDPKGTNVLWWVDNTWNPVIWLQNSGARVDNYSLNYK